MLIPAFGFLLSGATIATGIKNAKGYRDDKALAVITFQRAVRNATVQGIVFIIATGIILYGVYTGSGLASNPSAWRALSSIVDAKTLQAA